MRQEDCGRQGPQSCVSIVMRVCTRQQTGLHRHAWAWKLTMFGTLTATWSIYFFAAFASVSWHTTYRSRNSYTICLSNVPAISVQHVIPCDLA